MEPFDEAWMQNISLIMYLVILLNMVRLWWVFRIMRYEIDEVFGWVGDMHHRMGLCDCGNEAELMVVNLDEVRRSFDEVFNSVANSEEIRAWDEGDDD